MEPSLQSREWADTSSPKFPHAPLLSFVFPFFFPSHPGNLWLFSVMTYSFLFPRMLYQCNHGICAQSLSYVWLFVTPWIVTCQVPMSMEFSRQEYWSGLPFPTPGNLPKSRQILHLGSPGPHRVSVKAPSPLVHVFRGHQCIFREGRQLGALCASSLPAGFLLNVLLEEWRQNYSETSDFPAVGSSVMTKDSLSPDWWWGKNYILQRSCWDHLEFVCN